ncbi:MAG: hypothetical protein WCJ64_24090 [Rhodospirillaceae bacterium]
MAAVAFDTYRIVKRLKEAGFDEKQAEAVTSAIQESTAVDLSHVVTVEHFDQRINEVFGHVKEVETQLKSSISALENRLDSSVAGLEGKIASSVAGLEGKISALENRLESSVAGLEGKISALENRLESSVAGLETKIASSEARLEGKIASSEARLEAKIAESKADILKAVMGMIISAVAVNAVALFGGFIAFAKMLGH